MAAKEPGQVAFETWAKGTGWRCDDTERRAWAAAERAAAERAWDEGYGAAGKVVHPGVNPYRQPKGPTK